MRINFTLAVITSLAVLAASNVMAQNLPSMLLPKRIDPVKIKGEIPLYPAGAPKLEGAAASEVWNLMGSDTIVRNVSVPTLTPYLPDPAKATGAAVLVAPGGGFMLLAIKNEGWEVAQWLADHGVAAFLLKYRVNPTPVDEAAFDQFGREFMSRSVPRDANAPPPPAFEPAMEDGIAALKMIRSRASEWKVDPNRLGMIGFSAGAMNTLAVTLAQREGARPAFIGLIYGPMGAITVPKDAPPLFAALAADDPLFGRGGTGILDSWRQAGRPFEFHFYQTGGHGFGMLANGTTTQLWPDEFLAWLRMNGFLQAAKP